MSNHNPGQHRDRTDGWVSEWLTGVPDWAMKAGALVFLLMAGEWAAKKLGGKR